MEVIIKETLGKNVRAGEVKDWPMETLAAVARQAGRPIESFARPVSDDARAHFKTEGLGAEPARKRGRPRKNKG